MKYLFKIIIILIILSFFSFLISQSNDGIGRGLDNREKDNEGRDEIFLDDLVNNYKENNGEVANEIIGKPKFEDYKDVLEYYDNPYTPELNKIYEKPISLIFEKWDFYNNIGINNISKTQLENKKNKLALYYIAYYDEKTNILLRLEIYNNSFLQDIYIFNEKELIKYIIRFISKDDMSMFIEYSYDENNNLIREDYYENAEFIEYVVYEYYGNKNKKIERQYSYDGIPKGKWKYFDEIGNITKKELYIDGVFFSYINYEYDKNGIEIKRTYYDENSNLIKYWIRNYDKITYYNSKDEEISWTNFLKL